MRKLTAQQEDECSRLYRMGTLFVEFVYGPYDAAGVVGQEFLRTLKRLFDSQDVRGMKVAFRDIDEWYQELEASDRASFRELLRKRLGEEWPSRRPPDRKRLERILRRGSIASEVERRFLESFIEGLEAGDQEFELRLRIESLLRG